jgi:hypothetical protein
MRYANYEKSFPGLQAEAVEMPLRVGSASFAISPRASAWMQPQNQAFKTKESAFGGMLGARFETRGKTRLQLYIDAELKSAGWIAGRPSLESGGTFRTGMTYALGKTR